MQPFFDFLSAAHTWISLHPTQTLEILLVMWGLANIVWAQWPKPHSAQAQKFWTGIHDALLLVATHASAKGTFTWPSIIRLFTQGPDPFGALTPPAEKPPQDPPIPPATVG